MRMAVGSDQRTGLTDAILEDLRSRGVEMELHGALSPGDDPAWPGVGFRVASRVGRGEVQWGLLCCWTGTGVSMAANKVPGARAALCADAPTAAGARRWNDANILCLSLRLTSPEVAREVLAAWFDASPDESERGNIERLRRFETECERGVAPEGG